MKKETRLKRLFYQSYHRGCKETDLILGNFARDYLNKLNDAELNLFENLLSEKDLDIYDWATGREKLPEKYNVGLVGKIFDTE